DQPRFAEVIYFEGGDTQPRRLKREVHPGDRVVEHLGGEGDGVLGLVLEEGFERVALGPERGAVLDGGPTVQVEPVVFVGVVVEVVEGPAGAAQPDVP